MKLSKKKIFALALAVCLIAILSMGSLAWFTDSDQVTNNFLVAGSENGDPDEIFSVDVWEKDDQGNRYDDGIEYPAILPGDNLYKEVNVENTGSYDQYIRVTVTVSDATLWKEIYGTDEIVPLDELTNFDVDSAYYTTAYFDGAKDAFVYYLYYNKVLKPGDIMNVFTEVNIPEQMDRDQAAQMGSDGFYINVVADAVQTKNVGKNVLEAFHTVGLLEEIPDNTVYTKVYTLEELRNALAAGENPKLMADITATEADYITYSSGVVTCLNITNDAVINLNGFNLTFEQSSDRVMAMYIVDCDVTFKGQGTAKASDKDGDTLIWAKGDSLVTIESGNYEAASVFYASDNANISSEIVVNGGNFVCSGDDAVNIKNHGFGSVTYYGGTFNWDPSVEDADDAPYINVASGYVIEDNLDGTYSVFPTIVP